MEPNFLDFFERARRGDHLALEQLLVALSDRFYRYACTVLGHREDAEDTAQETALALIKIVNSTKRIYHFPKPENFKAFVFLIAARTSWRIRKKRIITRDQTDYQLTELLDPLSDDDSVGRADDIRCLNDALHTLDQGSRELLELRHIQALNSTQIARLTNKNANTIRTQLITAQQKLKDAIVGTAPQLATRLFCTKNTM